MPTPFWYVIILISTFVAVPLLSHIVFRQWFDAKRRFMEQLAEMSSKGLEDTYIH